LFVIYGVILAKYVTSVTLRHTVTCNPSKKLSPMMMTVEPPVVHPSLGEMALITGTAAEGYNPGYSAEIEKT
jgi:hypothetical protein